MSEYSENEEIVPVFLTSVKQEPDSFLTEPEDLDSYASLSHSLTSVGESDEGDLDYIITTQEGTPLYDSREPDVTNNLKPKPKSRKRRRTEDSPEGRAKRRKRCGECGPCQVRENCGECLQCLRRSVLKQSCIYRKCLYLRKPVKTPVQVQTQSSVNQSEAQYVLEYSANGDADGDGLLPDDTALLERPMVLLSPESPRCPSPTAGTEEEEDIGAASVEFTAPNIVPASSPSTDQPVSMLAQDNSPMDPIPESLADEGPSSEDFFQKRILNPDGDRSPEATTAASDTCSDLVVNSEDHHRPQRELLRQRILERKLALSGAVPVAFPPAFPVPEQVAVPKNLVIECPHPPAVHNVEVPSDAPREEPEERTIVQDILVNASVKSVSHSQNSSNVSVVPGAVPGALPEAHIIVERSQSRESQPVDVRSSDTPRQGQEERTVIKGILESAPLKSVAESSKDISKAHENQTSICEKPLSRSRCSSVSKRSRRRSSGSPASVHSNCSRENPYDKLPADPSLRAARYHNEASGQRIPYHMLPSSVTGIPQSNGFPFSSSLEARCYPPRMGFHPMDPRSSPAELYNLPPGHMRPVLYGDRLPGFCNMPPRSEHLGHLTPPVRSESNRQSPAEPYLDSRRQHPAALPDSQKHALGLHSSRASTPVSESQRQFSPLSDAQREYLAMASTPVSEPYIDSRRQHPATLPDSQKHAIGLHSSRTSTPISESQRQFSPLSDAQRQYLAIAASQHAQGRMNPPPMPDSQRNLPPPGFMDPHRFPSPEYHPYRYGPRPEFSRFPPLPERYSHPGAPRPPHINPNVRHPPPNLIPPEGYPLHTGQPPRLFSPWMPHGMPLTAQYPGDIPPFPPGFPMDMIRAGSGPPMGSPFYPRFPGPVYRSMPDQVAEDLEPGEVRRYPPPEFHRPGYPAQRSASPSVVQQRRNSPIPSKDTDKPPMDDHLQRYLDDVYRNFTCFPSRPSSLPDKADRQLSEQSSLTDYERETISIDDFHVSAYIRADGTNSVEIEFDQNSLLEDGRSSATCDLSSPSKQAPSQNTGEPGLLCKEVLVDGKPFKIGLCGTVKDTVVLKQDLGDEGIVQIEIPGEKFIIENVLLDSQTLASSSNLEKLLQFVTATTASQTGIA